MVSAKLRFVLVVVLLAAYTSPVHSQPTGHERKYFFFTELSFKIIQTYLPNVAIICISSTLVNIFLQFYITFSSQDRYGTVYKSYELWNMIFAKEPLYTSIQGRGLKRLPSGLSSFHNQNRLMLLSLIFSNIK